MYVENIHVFLAKLVIKPVLLSDIGITAVSPLVNVNRDLIFGIKPFWRF